VARLWTDEALKTAGLESVGVWCLSRGLARGSDHYKRLLHQADHPRQGQLDGRGALSEKTLMEFCDYMLDQALDQVSYISELLHFQSLRHRVGRYVEARNDGRVPGQTRPLKAGAARVLFAAFQEGELARSEALGLTGEHSERNARRLLSQLRDEGLLSETNNRSPLRWEIPEHAEPWYFPELTPGV
jgi:Fic family protein